MRTVSHAPQRRAANAPSRLKAERGKNSLGLSGAGHYHGRSPLPDVFPMALATPPDLSDHAVPVQPLARTYPRGWYVEPHRHDWGQLLYAMRG